MTADMLIIIPCLGGSSYESVINFWRYVAIAIDGAIDELHFERAESFAVPNGGQATGVDRFSRDSGNNLLLISSSGAAEAKQCI